MKQAQELKTETENASKSSDPRLLYLADVKVEPAMSGSALIYRQLGDWAPESLLVVERHSTGTAPEKRLPGVRYHTWSAALPWRFSRFALVRLLNALCGPMSIHHHANSLLPLARSFGPDAVLTVAHGAGFLAAGALAKKLQVPLITIVHDNFADMIAGSPRFRRLMEARANTLLKSSDHLIFVCDSMRDYFVNQHGLDGSVLYPTACREFPQHPPEPPARGQRPFTVAYGGTVIYLDEIRALIDAAGRCGARMVFYSNVDPASAKDLGFVGDHVEFRQPVPSTELVERLRKEADLLLVPMQFAENQRVRAITGFPSKIADYSMTGLPILIYGPKWCSAATWARKYIGEECVCDVEDIGLLSEAMGRFRNAEAASSIGEKCFSVGARMFGLREARELIRRVVHEVVGQETRRDE
jgi:glycosyltransferase involved in cell wall biosynthesis